MSVGLSRAQLALPDDSLVPIRRAFDAVLRGIAFEREQANNRIAAFAQTIDTRIGGEFYWLPYAEFVL
jgi:hypothetical protein